jgi:hypothetical protein
VSLPCPSPGLKGKIYTIGFIYEINESCGNSKYGAAKSPGLGHCPSSIFFRQNNICMSAVVDSQYGARTVAAESLIAQLHSKAKLTTLSRENRKIRHEIEILETSEHDSHVKELQVYGLIQKTYVQIS